MEVSTRFVGSKTKPHKVALNWRQTTNFAASIGDNNPSYFDDERPDGIVAPPMIVAALTWPVSLNIGDYLIADAFPAHLQVHQVHYSESVIWHTLMRPEDHLTINGELVALLNHPIGTHMVMRYEAANADGTPVFTEYTGAILRGVKIEGPSIGKENCPPINKYNGGADPAWVASQHIDPLAPYIYDGCADISFPIHTSPKFAKSVGLPGIILHGTATLGMAVRELVNRETDGNPGRLKELDCNFTDMVMPGSDINIRLLGREDAGDGTNLFFEVTNDSGRKAISRGRLKVDNG
jgi:hypothetical protein